MTNLYDVLEVSKKASKEVIDKAYKVLAKKYHPDLQEDDEAKKIAEEKMKKINEAYKVLSNADKRKLYNLKLEQDIEEENRKKELEKLEKLQKEKGMQNKQHEEKTNIEVINEEIKNAYKAAYKKAYNDYIKNNGCKEKEPWTWDKVFTVLKALGIFIIIMLIIWLFPPTHKMIIDFYEQNAIIKTLVDIIGKIFIGIKNGFVSIATGKVVI